MKALVTLSFILSSVSFASTVSLSLAGDSSQWSTLTTTLETQPGFGQFDSINYRQVITTDGPVRSGFLLIQTGGHAGYIPFGYGELRSGFTGGPINMIDPQYNVPATVDIEVHCLPGAGCSPGNGYYGHYSAIPVTLGVAMTLESVGSIGYTGNFDAPGGLLDSVFQFRFLESDHITNNQHPVVASLAEAAVAPEPSALLPVLGAVLFGLWRVRR